MPRERKHPDDLTYREWHREASISRYMSVSEAASLKLIDGDLIEVCPRCYRSLLLMEVTEDFGQKKNAGIIEELAIDANTTAVLIYFMKSPDATFTTSQGVFPDLVAFRVLRLWPEPRTEFSYTPEAWAKMLLRIRRKHLEADAEDCARRMEAGLERRGRAA